MGYVIKTMRVFYGPTTKVHVERDTESGQVLVFRKQAQAQAFVEGMEAQPYHLAHNESGRPDYRVVHISKVADHLLA